MGGGEGNLHVGDAAGEVARSQGGTSPSQIWCPGTTMGFLSTRGRGASRDCLNPHQGGGRGSDEALACEMTMVPGGGKV